MTKHQATSEPRRFLSKTKALETSLTWGTDTSYSPMANLDALYSRTKINHSYQVSGICVQVNFYQQKHK